MSRKINLLVLIAVAGFAFLSIVVYSRQAAEDNRKNEVTAAPQKFVANQAETQEPEPRTQKAMCTLNTGQAPDIRGLRLGMSVEPVLALFPGSREDAEVNKSLAEPAKFGLIRLMIRPERYASKENFVGTRNITLAFLDGKLFDITVAVSGSERKHVDELIKQFSEEKNLPAPADWQPYVGLDDKMKTLQCDGFEISVLVTGHGIEANHIRIQDLAADKEWKDRRAKAREKAAREAKP